MTRSERIRSRRKVRTAAEGPAALEQLPNIGPAIAADLRRVGITRPQDLLGRDPVQLYRELERVTGSRHDPCVLDVFLSAVRFMAGAEAHPWWRYTPERKAMLAAGPDGRGGPDRPANAVAGGGDAGAPGAGVSGA